MAAMTSFLLIHRFLNVFMLLLLFKLMRNDCGVLASDTDGSPALSSWDAILKKEYDICNPDTLVYNPATIYLPKPGSTTELYVKLLLVETVPGKCLFVVKTCSQCQVGVQVLDPEFDFTYCHKKTNTYFERCPYFTFYDGDYREQTTKTIQASHSLGNFSSESRYLYIESSRSFDGAMSTNEIGDVIARFRVYSKSKYKVISRQDTGSTKLELTSPFFPDPCIQNGETYRIVINNLWDDFFVMTFDDWLMPLDAELRYSVDSLFNAKGSDSRRSVYSHQPRMEMTFYTGSYIRPGTYFGYPGFRATITFSNSTMKIPVTDCDKVVEDFGGIIQMDSDKMDGSYRDCIWLVKKPLHAEGIHLTQKLMKYIYPWFNIEIREDIVSKGDLKFKLDPSYDRYGLVHSLSTRGKGFYIRITGRLFHKDTLVFHYTAFTTNCHINSKTRFQCDNGHCIDTALRCDGVNHCGDDSDESKRACRTGTPDDSETDSHVGVGIIVPLVVSLVVVFFFCLFLVCLQRCYRLRLQRLPVRDRPPSSSSSSSTRGRDYRQRRRQTRAQSVQMSVTVTSGELPPSYNEVMMSAPLSNVNVAFTFGPGDGNPAFTSPPPSYGEAVQADNFDLSRSTSREVTGPSSLSSDTSAIAAGHITTNALPITTETSFSNTAPPELPAYTPSPHSNRNNINSLSSTSDPGCFGVPLTDTASSLVASFDPNEYVSSSSSTECYDDDNYQQRNFDRDCRYPSDSSTTDDDEMTNGLYAQALNLVSVNSSSLTLGDNVATMSSSPVMSRELETAKHDKAKSKDKYKDRRENADHLKGARYSQSERERRRVDLEENNPNNVRRGWEEENGRFFKGDESGWKNSNEHRGRTGNARHDSWVSDTSSNSSCPERRSLVTENLEGRRRPCDIMANVKDGSDVPNLASSQGSLDMIGRFSVDLNDPVSSPRYSWIPRNEVTDQQLNDGATTRSRRNGIDEDLNSNFENVNSTVVPLTVTNYLISPEHNEGGSDSIPVPLAQVLFTTTEEEASFV